MYEGIKQKEAEAGKFRNKIQAVKQSTTKVVINGTMYMADYPSLLDVKSSLVFSS